MKTRVLFLADHEWSLGRLVSDLSKYLWQYNIDVQLLSWQKLLEPRFYHQMLNTIDWFVTSTGGTPWLYKLGIPLERCIDIFYHSSDLLKFINTFNSDQCNRVGRLATVSKELVDMADTITKLTAKVKYIKVGYNSHAFYSTPSQKIDTLGFASAFRSREDTSKGIAAGVKDPWVYKRGYLVQETAIKAGINFSNAEHNCKTFRTMPAWYNSVDIVSCSSLDQGAGGPVYEAGLAGRLVITSNVGDFANAITQAGADIVPNDEHGFVEESTRLISYYKSNPNAYKDRCYSIRDHALKNYDWSNFIPLWANLFKT